MENQQFCLKWNNHMNNMMEVFKGLLSTESMVDVTLACDGLSLKAHKVVLSACSPFFKSLFLENPCQHPIVILKDVRYKELKAIIEFMYHGEVNVAQDQLNSLMKTAETLRVKGLAENTSDREPDPPREERRASSSVKRKRGRVRKRSRSDSGSDYSDDEPKVKHNSPDIEELTGGDMNNSSGHFSSVQSRAPVQSTPSQSNMRSVVPHVEEPQSADESEFGMEPAKLMHQTMTTKEHNTRSRRPVARDVQRGSLRSADHASNQVIPMSPVVQAESSVSIDMKPNIEDIETLDPDLPPDDSMASEDNSMGYLDQSEMSPMPGTSYQDSTALVPVDGSSQVVAQDPPRKRSARARRFTCRICGMSFARQDSLKAHRRTHMEARPFKCSYCEHRCSQLSNLKRHVQIKHKGMDLYYCAICDMGFGKRTQLSRHNREEHTEETVSVRRSSKEGAAKVSTPRIRAPAGGPVSKTGRSLKCKFCDKVFGRLYNVKVHERIHTKSMVYRCNLCPHECNQLSNLKRHLMVVHNHENLYPCDVCKVEFRTKKILNDHMASDHGVGD